jgi:hypothetical protein
MTLDELEERVVFPTELSLLILPPCKDKGMEDPQVPTPNRAHQIGHILLDLLIHFHGVVAGVLLVELVRDWINLNQSYEFRPFQIPGPLENRLPVQGDVEFSEVSEGGEGRVRVRGLTKVLPDESRSVEDENREVGTVEAQPA